MKKTFAVMIAGLFFCGFAAVSAHSGSHEGGATFTKHFNETLFSIAEKGQVTIEVLLDEKEYKIGKDVVGIVVHDSHDEDVEVFLRDAGISYSTGYGMTETAPIMTINPFGRVKVGSCGQPIPGIEMKIHEPDAQTGIGEIVVRGPIVMSGYYNNPDATAEIFLPGGWLKTGDLGFFDDEGYLFIKGRCKNVIIGPSGENIYPEAIEQKILQEPYFQETVVYESQGRLLAKAYLDFDVLDREFERNKLNDAEAHKLTEEILEQARQRINTQLPAFSQLSRILEHPEPFEKTPTNKVKRYLYITRSK
jgi:long-chain acyl-CoA synthetase